MNLPENRTIAFLLLVLVGLIVGVGTDLADGLGHWLQLGYTVAMPLIFGAFIVGGVYFGVRHLLRS